jgi:hypothetical protein
VNHPFDFESTEGKIEMVRINPFIYYVTNNRNTIIIVNVQNIIIKKIECTKDILEQELELLNEEVKKNEQN